MTENAPEQTTVPHPWYGPCDALAPGGMCAECAKRTPESDLWLRLARFADRRAWPEGMSLYRRLWSRVADAFYREITEVLERAKAT